MNGRQFICCGGALGVLSPLALGTTEVSEIGAFDKLPSTAANRQALGGLLLQLQQAADSVASGNRETTAAQEIEVFQKRMTETGAQAVKFKVGGRMSHNHDPQPQRSEQRIALSRKTLGDNVTIQADANGSYDVEHAIKFGHKLQDINAYLFEEPCRFDHIDETKHVANALEVHISGGEQESTEYRFKQMLAKNMLQIVQPDLHYYDGFFALGVLLEWRAC